MIIPFGTWTPDFEAIGSPHLVTAAGCLPTIRGYEPFRAVMATTDALGNACLGATLGRDKDQAGHVYSGDSTALYELEGFAWTDRSKSGGYGPTSSSGRWRFTSFGDLMLATNGQDPIQSIAMSSAATQFADLGGSPPTAKYIAAFREFVALGSLGSSGIAIKWSGFNDAEEWTAGTNQSDEQEFYDGGQVTGLGSVDVLYVFQERTIRRVNYVGGAAIMQIDKLTDGVGCVEPGSLVQYGSLFFFLSEDGFYQFDGGQVTPIGTGIDGGAAFSNWFLADSARAYWTQMRVAIDPNRRLVCWAYASTGSGGSPDTLLFYNWVSRRATYVRYPVQHLFSAVSLGISPDDLTSTDVDTLTLSFDDPYFLGGAGYFAAFNSQNRLGTFTGETAEATFETGDFQMADGARTSIEWIRPIIDTTAARVAGGCSLRPGDTPAFRASVSQQTSGRCPQRNVNGTYFRSRATVPAGSAWTYATGIEVKGKKEGSR